MAAGRAGGTQITIRFKNLSMKVVGSMPILMNELSKQMKPKTAMQAIKRTNFIASSWNLNLICFG